MCGVFGTWGRSQWWHHHLRWPLRSLHVQGHLQNFGQSSFFSSPLVEPDRSLFGAAIFTFFGAHTVPLLIRNITDECFQKTPLQIFSFTLNLGSVWGGSAQLPVWTTASIVELSFTTTTSLQLIQEHLPLPLSRPPGDKEGAGHLPY